MRLDIPKELFGPDRQLKEIKEAIVFGDLPRILKKEQARGFPKDEKDFSFYVRSGGRESKRQLKSIRPNYLKIGTARRPTEFKWVAHTSIEDVLVAVRAALAMARKRAPVISGSYKNSIAVMGDAGKLSEAALQRPDGYDRDAIFRITSFSEYGAIIEHGHYTGYYGKRNNRRRTPRLAGGILFWVTQEIRRQFPNVSVRFMYLGGVREGSGGGGTVPVIEIGRAGLFAGNDTRPGSASRRRKRRRRTSRR